MAQLSNGGVSTGLGGFPPSTVKQLRLPAPRRRCSNFWPILPGKGPPSSSPSLLSSLPPRPPSLSPSDHPPCHPRPSPPRVVSPPLFRRRGRGEFAAWGWESWWAPRPACSSDQPAVWIPPELLASTVGFVLTVLCLCCGCYSRLEKKKIKKEKHQTKKNPTTRSREQSGFQLVIRRSGRKNLTAQCILFSRYSLLQRRAHGGFILQTCSPGTLLLRVKYNHTCKYSLYF